MAAWIKMPLGMEAGLGPRDFVLDGDPSPPPQNGRSPQFSALVYCAQTAGWITVALGMEIGLGPGHIMLDGDPATLSKKGAEPTTFRRIGISVVATRLDGSRCRLVRR